MEQLILKSNKRRNQLCLNVIITHIFKVQKAKMETEGGEFVLTIFIKRVPALIQMPLSHYWLPKSSSCNISLDKEKGHVPVIYW